MEPEKPERHKGTLEEPSDRANPKTNLSMEGRSKVTRAAFLRPINLTMLLIGGGFFAIVQSWWIISLTLVTYVLLAMLAARDPLFQRKILDGNDATSLANSPNIASDIPPERRARWLPRGETRSAVEEALENYRRLAASIETSGEVARSVLGDVVPRLHAAAERLVDVAHEREKVAEAVQEISSRMATTPDEELLSILRGLKGRVKRADEEISDTRDRLLTLRARMVGASLNSEAENRVTASELNRSLKELNFRLEALGEISSEAHDTRPQSGNE